jgi:tetratricopeptide (TPR) repeat protein
VLIPVSAEDFARRKRRIILAVVAAGVILAGAAAWVYKRSTDPLRAREAYDAGERLLKVARYPQAILSFDGAIALQEDFAGAYLLRGRSHVGLSETEEAIQDFTKVIQLRPKDAQAYLDRGAAYLDLKNYPAAIGDCNKVIEIDPQKGSAFNLRGTARRATGDLKGAADDFVRAVQLSPNLDNYFQRGATYQLMGQHKLAIADFDQVIEFSPYNPQGYFARAESRRALGDIEGARKDHEQARQLDGR